MKPLEVDSVELRGTQLVEASAGTGKTFAIAHLFLRLLLEPEGRARLEPREILVVTYTKAATAELRARIRRRLRQAMRALRDGEKPEDEILGALVERRRAAGRAGSDAEHLQECIRGLDEAAIHTIHAFCQRALRQVAFRSGADFEVDVLEDSRPLLREIARDFWAARLAGAPEILVAFLNEHPDHKLGIEQLVRLAERITTQPLAQILPERGERPAPPGVPAEWPTALAEIARLWPAARAEVRALLVDSGAMNRGTYRAHLVDRWLAQLDAELSRPRPGVAWRMQLERLGNDHIGRWKLRSAPKPEHPLFDACTRLLEIERELESTLRDCARDLLLDFASGVRAELERRLHAAGLRSFDEVLLGLQRALLGSAGAELASTLAARYTVALIDESQDTDLVQYEIFQRIWHAAGAPLFLIGDPKQAIYSFRGADVHAYLGARADARTRFTLDVSRRSDPALVRAINSLFMARSDPFGLPALEYRPLEARSDASDALPGPALELLVASDGERVEEGVAAEIALLLSRPPRLTDRELRADDVAVLCRTNDQARRIRDELHLRGVEALLLGDASVFQSDAAEDVERVARALAHPGDPRRLRAALATPLLGVSALELETMAQWAAGWDEWQGRVQRAHERWRDLGFCVALRTLLDDSRGSARLLAELGGERRLTDALQLGELMHLAERKLHLGELGLVRWLAAARAGALARGAGDWIEDVQIRFESENPAVHLTTVHRSKGLEYGVVFVPFGWKAETLRDDERRFVRFHRDSGQLAFDLGCPEPHRGSHLQAARLEAGSEAMRLLYVAMTRARHACKLVYADGQGASDSALGRLLGTAKGESPDQLLQRFAALPGALGCRSLARAHPISRVAPAAAGAPGPPRVLGRPLGRARRTSSYTDLVRVMRGESAGRDHDAEIAAEEGAELPESGRDELARGPAVGLALHEVLEHLDFPGADPDAVRRAVERASELRGLDAGSRAALARSVLAALDTPLPPAGRLRLRNVTLAERLSELEFLLPVGDARGDDQWLKPARLAEPFARFASRPELRAYARRVARLEFAQLAGHLRGFVDLIIRREGRWYLLDYKSNYLGAAAQDYAPERLVAPMLEHHYALQYHLYALALHRLLARRVAGYDYARDFGGVYYLFVRGMSPSNPLGSGVWFDTPPRALIDALGRALERPGEVA
jgi:exodeoxyribonuclease V beta subunit